MNKLFGLVAPLILSAMTLASPVAMAHAVLKHSVPAAGATVSPAPKEIALKFNENVEPAFSAVTLSDDAGKAIATGKAQPDGTDATTLRLAVPVLPPGVYRVQWIAVGHDGHRRNGNFTFKVK